MLLNSFLIVVVLLKRKSLANSQYNTYDDDCLDHYAQDKISSYHSDSVFLYRKEHQIIPFCRRDTKRKDELILVSNDIPSMTFDDLMQRNITSTHLFSWSIPVDLIEEYEAFREKPANGSLFKIYNCSRKSQFGRFCQYSFNSQGSFDEILTKAMKETRPALSTCYVHLNCTRGDFSWCLSWREICDGRVDCWPNPVDEEHCEQLEQNECQPNEYRCFNGQCIPQSFLFDNPYSPDCLDRTDERLIETKYYYPESCQLSNTIIFIPCDPAFRCTEIVCPHWSLSNGTDKPTTCGLTKIRYYLTKNFHRHIFSLMSNTHISKECWAIMICLVDATKEIDLNDPSYVHLFNGSCHNVCSKWNTTCRARMIEYCPPLFEFPAHSLGWNEVHLVYSWNQTTNHVNFPDYICYDARSCSISKPVLQFRKLTCELPDLGLFNDIQKESVALLHGYMASRCSTSNVTEKETDCSMANQFRCGKKCLSKHRLVDNFQDCFDGMDETYNQSCALSFKHRVKCSSTSTANMTTICIPKANLRLRQENNCQTEQFLPQFSTLCDGCVDYSEKINGVIETDEINCEYWQCDNQYSRCDGFWDCPNGADEARCFHPICDGLVGHPCVLYNTSEYICLPLAHANDGIIDCVGGLDERRVCQDKFRLHPGFLCQPNQTDTHRNISENSICLFSDYICSQRVECPLGDDEPERYCKNSVTNGATCGLQIIEDRRTKKENIFCDIDHLMRSCYMRKGRGQHFSLTNYSIHPPLRLLGHEKRVQSKSIAEKNDSLVVQTRRTSMFDFFCLGHGIPVNLDDQVICLCPPSLYGSSCEYENQRVSVTLQIGAPEWRTPFSLIAYLIDDKDGTVQSYHQTRYLSIRDCSIKFNFHLLYLTRPKAMDRSYSVRIDAYEAVTLHYRGSWLFPIAFPFLPVYRLAIHVSIPFQRDTFTIDSSTECSKRRGRWILSVNTNQHICHCESGWSGKWCNEPYQCNCAPNSICVGVWKNQSICVCPLNKYGPRCYLNNDFCEQKNGKQCQNNGLCVPRDPRILVDDATTCSCSLGFSGELCEKNEMRIDLFINIPNIKDSVLIHFITVNSHPPEVPYVASEEWGPHERSSTFKRIPFNRDMVTVYWSSPFHVIFAELEQDIYLIHTQANYTHIDHLSLKIEPHQRCPPISKLLSDEIVRYHRLRRVKYYHIPCQERHELLCFHDSDQYLCLCTDDHRANCFIFDYQSPDDCQQLSYCENGGRCLQDNDHCPTAAICACPTCYLGNRCQVSTRGFGLPLDTILSYQILPELSFIRQPTSVLVSGIVTILMVAIGVMNGLFSIMTFNQEMLRQVGCGVYLFVASILSMVIIVIFTLKYIFLILIQLSIVQNHVFVSIQCSMMDFLFKVTLQIEEWLYACVAIERLTTVIKGSHFNKQLSRRLAKYVIMLICICVSGTSIQEVLYRTLVNDEDNGKVWCLVRYPKSLSTFFDRYTSISTVIHCVAPFTINLFSALLMIYLISKHHSKLQHRFSFQEHIGIQLRQHAHVIISPIFLVLLALPRLILSFQLTCIKSARDSVALFLVSYFISSSPPILIFIIFVLPSVTYKTEFRRVMKIYYQKLKLFGRGKN